jgi:DNA transformation protein and related proteins
MENTNQLEKLPNIGSNLAQLLRESGINTPQELYENGAIQTFMRLRAVDPEACLS